MTAHDQVSAIGCNGTGRPAWFQIFLGMALLVYLGLSVANLYFGELNQDEGWYLYAARLAAEGQQPYRDFAFTQGPVFLTVYSWANPLVEQWGVMGGRLFTGILGWSAILLAGWLAARLTPGVGARSAAAIAMILLLCNVYHSYHSLVVKTYSLCALLIVAAALCLTGKEGNAKGWGVLLAGLLFALAAGVRLSAGIWLPVVGLYLVWQRRKQPMSWLYFGLGGALGLAVAFGPAFLRAPQETWFWLVQYHAARDPGAGWFNWVYKAGFISRFMQAYFVPAMLLFVTGVLMWATRARARLDGRSSVLWAGVAALTLVHLAAPFPYDDYQVFIMPLFAALLGSGLVRVVQPLIPEARYSSVKPLIVFSVLVVSVTAALSSPLNQAWVLRERDRIWWRLKEQPDLVLLQQTAQWLNEQRGDDERLLTQDIYLAVETGMRVPDGLEMGAFSYYPDWTREDAERRRVLNRDMMKELLKTTDASWAAFSGYGLAIRSPDVAELSAEEQAALRAIVERRYARVKQVPHFGQAHTTLEIWTLLNPEP